ncbi:MAG: hypothetical protein HZA77_14370 [Candidatus Schekmanbacteria bacterium]|nr:hypothetical protein [Candidatus Schekmanbacteria bacterium]
MKRREFLEKGKKTLTVAAAASVVKKWISPKLISLDDSAYADTICPKKNDAIEKANKKCRQQKGKHFS